MTIPYMRAQLFLPSTKALHQYVFDSLRPKCVLRRRSCRLLQLLSLPCRQLPMDPSVLCVVAATLMTRELPSGTYLSHVTYFTASLVAAPCRAVPCRAAPAKRHATANLNRKWRGTLVFRFRYRKMKNFGVLFRSSLLSERKYRLGFPIPHSRNSKM